MRVHDGEMAADEESVSRFYETRGWETNDDGVTEDAQRWEDLRGHARKYVSNCRLRVLRHIPEEGEYFLEVGSGPLQFDEYLEYSKNYAKRYCVDLSSAALEGAKKRIGDHGVFLHGNFLDIQLDENFFDCAVSLHVIYHIDKDRQEAAVRKLVEVVKPGKPVIIVYSNPETLYPRVISSFPGRVLLFPIRLLRKIKRYVQKPVEEPQRPSANLYFHPRPLEWWSRFSDVAAIELLPWRSFDSNDQKKLLPNNKLGGRMLDLLFYLEDRFPRFFVKHFQYPMIVLTKR